ncbi:MAG: DUF1572 domain-containing protein [Bacteroidetes bacterium]|nr:DUF1572 domain-containing protein [Bacteroidota bacterium]
MNVAKQIAKHFRDVHYGGNWTGVNIKDSLTGLSWEQATTKVHSFNTIAVLVFHMNYYVGLIIKVLEGGPLDGSDKYSFDLPPIRSEEDWQRLLDKYWKDADTFIALVEQLPDSRLAEDFSDKKYGDYYRNLHGVTEHCHYHLGQISLIKKLVIH